MPRCPLAWPHATSCGAAWRRLIALESAKNDGGGRSGSESEGEGARNRATYRLPLNKDPSAEGDALSRRSEKEHLGHSRRLLRLLRRARSSAARGRAIEYLPGSEPGPESGVVGAGSKQPHATTTTQTTVTHVDSSEGGNTETEEGAGGAFAFAFEELANIIGDPPLERLKEEVVRDGTVCPCARSGLVVVWGTPPVRLTSTVGGSGGVRRGEMVGGGGGGGGGGSGGNSSGRGQGTDPLIGGRVGGGGGGGECEVVDGGSGHGVGRIGVGNCGGKRKKGGGGGGGGTGLGRASSLALEDTLTLVASAPPRLLLPSTQSSGGTSGVSPLRARFQEGWLETGGTAGSPGVVAVELQRLSAGDAAALITIASAADVPIVAAAVATTAEEATTAGAVKTALAVCGALDASGRSVICAEIMIGPTTTQVWALWWPQRCVGGDERDEGSEHGGETAARPLGDLHSHLSDTRLLLQPVSR